MIGWILLVGLCGFLFGAIYGFVIACKVADLKPKRIAHRLDEMIAEYLAKT